MATPLSPIIQPSELSAITGKENLVILDASNHPNARKNYDQAHIDGALFIDINTELADIKEDLADGGRHPLPELEDFVAALVNLGIFPGNHVVIYDDKSGANAAARCWWMLKAVGFKEVQVLNGGFQAAERAGLPINNKFECPVLVEPYDVFDWELPTVDLSEVEKASSNSSKLVIDVREAKRYNGETEPIDLIAGHIPGAINVPFTQNMDDNGMFKNPEFLRSLYKEILKDHSSSNVIVHCGSGVTACHTLLAMDYAGLEIPALYVGSWSEWSRNNKPIGTNL